MDALAPMDAIIASNTSRLDIFPLVPERRQPRTLIAHWYTPPYLVDLCDVVGSDRTDPAVIETVRNVVAAMGKVPVVMKRFIPGYIANRIQAAMMTGGAPAVGRRLRHAARYRRRHHPWPGAAHADPRRSWPKRISPGLRLMQAELANRSYEPPPVRRRPAPRWTA